MAEIDGDLDLLSTSQTTSRRCPYGAPLVAIVAAGQGSIKQACCNHWDCPVCGETRAKQEYHRIVYGAELLSLEHKLYFWTLTCRGREMPLAEAEEHYLEWTNRLLTNARTKAKRAGNFWAYVQVTERQRKTREHPHSHILTTFLPTDALLSRDAQGREVYISRWFTKANELAGLGSQHTITQVETASRVSRYVAKYLFKEQARDKFPPKWKRVRYSQNYPTPIRPKPDFVSLLNSPTGWKAAADYPTNFEVSDVTTWEMALHRMANVRYVRSVTPG